jgi:outer membrane receptor protein involved in Fe transport
MELDFVAKANSFISFTGMLSVGDWFYQGNAESTMFTESNEPITNGSAATTTLYLDKVKVGSSAQMTAAAGVTIKPAKDLDFNAQYRFVDNLYGNVNPINFQTQAGGDQGAMKLPSFWLMDIGASYKLRLNNPKQFFTLRANVYNLFDKIYIAESNTNVFNGLTADQYTAVNGGTVAGNAAKYASYVAAGNWNGVSQQNQVYFGFGTTWTASLSFNF